MTTEQDWPPVGYVSPIDPEMQAAADQLRERIEQEAQDQEQGR